MNETFAKFGKHFEEKFVSALLRDREFAEQCLDCFDIKYINAEYLKELTNKFLSYQEKYKSFPSFENIESVINSETKDSTTKLLIFDFLIKAKTESKSDLDYVKDKSVEFMKNRAVVNAIMTSVDLIQREQYDEIKKTIDGALGVGLSRDIGHDYLESFNVRASSSTRKTVTTGWLELDKTMSAHSGEAGGISGGELFIIICSTGIGKTSTMVYMGGAAVKQGKTVVHYTLELPDTDVGLRYDACLTGYPINTVTKYEKEVNAKLNKYKEMGSNLVIKWYPTKSATISTIERHLEQLRRRRIYPDLIIVDYADLLKIKKTGMKYADLQENYEELRRIAGEWDLPIISASQSNREGVDAKFVGISHIGESYGKACVADVIVSITRNNDDRVVDSGKLYLAKNRFGPDGLVFPAKMNLANVNIDLAEPITLSEANKLNEKAIKNKTAEVWEKMQKHAKGV